ncbi:MAG: 2OG-Fe(II) oxygenase [Polaromonas sp.]
MSKISVFDPSTPPDVQAWLSSQTAAGFSRTDMFNALCESGWRPYQAARMLGLSDDEKRVLGVAAVSSPGYASAQVPRPQLILRDVQVDGGDKLVRVLQQRTAPDLIEFEALLSDAECDALIQAAQPRLSRSLTVDLQTGGQEIHPDRSSQGMFFERAETPVIATIEARIAKLLGWPATHGENLQILRYPPGAQYVPHYDYFDPAQIGTAELLKRGGQRVATLIIYLHEPAGGGATVFPDIDLAITPKRGNAVFFSYAAPDPSTLSLHGGEPVTAGEKWIATKWLRQSVFE